MSLALSTTLNTDQILKMILIGVTAGQGLGFNRAFLLLLDDEEKYLVGKIAIGESDPEEAARIWDELSKKKLTFKEVLEFSGKSALQRDLEVKRIIGHLKISMEESENILVKAVKNKNSVHSHFTEKLDNRSNQFLIDLLGTQEFVVTPLMSKDKVLGVIIADNLITSKPIKDEDIKLLQIFANQASTAIENSRLYNELTHQVKKLEEANDSFPKLLGLLYEYAIDKLVGIDDADIEHYHRIRNKLYHEGTGLSVDEQYLRAYRSIASLLLENLFAVTTRPFGDQKLTLENLILNFNKIERIIKEKLEMHGIHGTYKWEEAFTASLFAPDDIQMLTEFRMARNSLVHSEFIDEKKVKYWVEKSEEILRKLREESGTS